MAKPSKFTYTSDKPPMDSFPKGHDTIVFAAANACLSGQITWNEREDIIDGKTTLPAILASRKAIVF